MKTAALALGAALLGCGYASAPGYLGRDYIPTAFTASRHEYHGFTVEPPRGPNWKLLVSEQRPDSATYRQELSAETHTFVASVHLIPLDANLPFEESAVPHGFTDPARNELIEIAHQPDTSRNTPCIRYSLLLLDKAAPNSNGAALHLLDKGLVCAHPTMPNTGVRASFSERGLPQELDPSLWDGFEAFLNSIQLESAPGTPAA